MTSPVSKQNLFKNVHFDDVEELWL